jgi:hypothetical protein
MKIQQTEFSSEPHDTSKTNALAPNRCVGVRVTPAAALDHAQVATCSEQVLHTMTCRWISLTQILPGNVLKVFAIEPRRITSVIRSANDTFSEICIDDRATEKIIILERSDEIYRKLPGVSKARKQRLQPKSDR